MTPLPDSGQLRAVVFDLDGLMFNTEALYERVGREVLRRRGRELSYELLDKMMGRTAPIALQLMIDWYGLDDSAERIAAETDEIFGTLLDEDLETMPGLMELLTALEAAKIPKGIATSSSRRFTTGVLARFQLEPRFKFILTAEDVIRGKPDPEIYLMATERLGLPTHQVLVLEDSENGCRAASHAGTYTVAVPSGRSRAHRFPGAQLMAESLADPLIYQALGIV